MLTDPVEVLIACGGIATRQRLARSCRRVDIDAALAAGTIVRAHRTLYRLPDLDRALAVAAACSAQVAVLSAAVAHGWEVALQPTRPWLKVGPGQRAPRARAHVIWGEPDEGTGLVTSERTTVLDCARRLPLHDALPVLDSALRHGYDHDTLRADAARLRGKGAPAARRAIGLASGRAANPFESRLRALAVEAGLAVEPQVELALAPGLLEPADPEVARPDLVDRSRSLVLEADSWEFHTGKAAFQADCWRYTVLTLSGWTVLRFTWWQVMHQPDWVRAALARYARDSAARAA
ncbi:hypothetical protein RDV89_19830 [Nocardioides zeae]|uniref:DUF559 domain-containing protein n=1 Tax=Nocardioides imazamoxiresistens TaxID=3231893 RepID=A0ABU3Q1H2_9ACTN|nr:hypothetical protein [Nocardioides zeae]MDT9595348.1 hypothetical protein [Nocardioides zeae]